MPVPSDPRVCHLWAPLAPCPLPQGDSGVRGELPHYWKQRPTALHPHAPPSAAYAPQLSASRQLSLFSSLKTMVTPVAGGGMS